MPTILFGAFDRHNFGDLLFPHIVAAMLPEADLRFAGLLERDLRPYGGHHVYALKQLALQGQPFDLIHVGGELLTCEAWQAAVMLLPYDEAQRAIAHLGPHPAERQQWAHDKLGIPALVPYTLSRQLFPDVRKVIYNGVGGVDLDRCEPAMQAEVIANLASADVVSVRDSQTQVLLQTAGIAARLIPDPAVMVAELFRPQIEQHASSGEPARILKAFSQSYIAVQFSSDFGDDATLATIAAQLDEVANSTGYGICFFRAGAAPWHDELSCYQRVAARMHTAAVQTFTSLDLWDICALIARSRAYCGSSLHGRIIAAAFGLPRISLLHPPQVHRPTKQSAYAATWELPDLLAAVEIRNIAGGIQQTLTADPQRLRQHAAELATRYRKELGIIAASLE